MMALAAIFAFIGGVALTIWVGKAIRESDEE